MRKAWKYITTLVTCFVIVSTIPACALRADSSFGIRLDQSIEDAVFTLTYEGPVEKLFLTSPSGYEIGPDTFPEAFVYEDGLIRVGVRTADKGRWGIRIIGKPEDGFRIVVTSDSSFPGLFWEPVAPSYPEESDEHTTDPIAETETSTSESKTTETQATQTGDTQQTQQESASETEASMSIPTETTIESEPLPPETAHSSTDPGIGNSSEEIVGDQADKNESYTSVVSESDLIFRPGQEATLDQEGRILKEIDVTISNETSNKDRITGGSAPDREGISGESMKNDTSYNDKGFAVYIGVFLPVLLSIGVFIVELRTRKRILVKRSYRQEKNHSSFQKKHPSKEEGSHDDSLWRTSTWQAPSRPR
jgi:hypothetical protein